MEQKSEWRKHDPDATKQGEARTVAFVQSGARPNFKK